MQEHRRTKKDAHSLPFPLSPVGWTVISILFVCHASLLASFPNTFIDIVLIKDEDVGNVTKRNTETLNLSSDFSTWLQ